MRLNSDLARKGQFATKGISRHGSSVPASSLLDCMFIFPVKISAVDESVAVESIGRLDTSKTPAHKDPFLICYYFFFIIGYTTAWSLVTENETVD